MSSARIWGRRPVLEALRAGAATRIFIAHGRVPSAILRDLRGMADRMNVPVIEVDAAEIARLVGSGPGLESTQPATQGVVADTVGPRETPLSLLLHAEDTTPPFLLVLDQIQDPHNLGALMRTAECVGVSGVVLPTKHIAPLSGVAVKASAGAAGYLRLSHVPNLARALEEIRRSNIWVVGLDGHAEQSLFKLDLAGPVALAIGSEGRGLRRLTREACDLLARIPMHGHVESLNVSVAGGIAMYEILRQRTAKLEASRRAPT